MSENEQKALALVAEAEKKLNSSKGFFGGLFGQVVQRLTESLYIFMSALNYLDCQVFNVFLT